MPTFSASSVTFIFRLAPHYVDVDDDKKTISYCVKNAAGQVLSEGKIGSTRRELDAWVRTLPEPRMMAMEATIFTGWIYDHLLPHAEKVKVAHPLMLRAIYAKRRLPGPVGDRPGEGGDSGGS